MTDKLTLTVSEVFYSLQGEGARAGEPSIFIRLTGCSAKHACEAKGVVCDTQFTNGVEQTMAELAWVIDAAVLRAVGRKTPPSSTPWIVWTGGEPLDQLTFEHVREFNANGYKQAIETSGVRPFPPGVAELLDWIVISPKVAEHILKKHFAHLRHSPNHRDTNGQFDVHELRYPWHAGLLGVPVPELKASHYYLSPLNDGNQINSDNVRHCVQLCLENPQWRMSVQQHKVWGVL